MLELRGSRYGWTNPARCSEAARESSGRPSRLQGALRSEDLVLPAEIARALDDVSALPVGYPEREG